MVNNLFDIRQEIENRENVWVFAEISDLKNEILWLDGNIKNLLSWHFPKESIDVYEENWEIQNLKFWLTYEDLTKKEVDYIKDTSFLDLVDLKISLAYDECQKWSSNLDQVYDEMDSAARWKVKKYVIPFVPNTNTELYESIKKKVSSIQKGIENLENLRVKLEREIVLYKVTLRGKYESSSDFFVDRIEDQSVRFKVEEFIDNYIQKKESTTFDVSDNTLDLLWLGEIDMEDAKNIYYAMEHVKYKIWNHEYKWITINVDMKASKKTIKYLAREKAIMQDKEVWEVICSELPITMYRKVEEIISGNGSDLEIVRGFDTHIDGNLNLQYVLYALEEANCLDKVKKVKLWGVFFEESKFPEEFSKLKNLEELSFFNNTLINIPPSIVKLKKLKKIEFLNNYLKDLPYGFSQLENLEIVNFSGHAFSSFPEQILDIPWLVDVNLSGSRFTTLDILPENISNLSKLQKLNLSSNLIWNIPISISELKNLEELDLSYNKVINLSIEMGEMKKLKKLNVYANDIFIPQVVMDLECEIIKNEPFDVE